MQTIVILRNSGIISNMFAIYLPVYKRYSSEQCGGRTPCHSPTEVTVGDVAGSPAPGG